MLRARGLRAQREAEHLWLGWRGDGHLGLPAARDLRDKKASTRKGAGQPDHRAGLRRFREQRGLKMPGEGSVEISDVLGTSGQ